MKELIKSFPTTILDLGCRFFRFAYLPYFGDWSGLGNRIKGIANFYALGYRRFLIAWNTKSWVTSPFCELFELPDSRIWECNPNGANIRNTCRGEVYTLLSLIFRRFAPTGFIRKDQPFWSFIVPKKYQLKEYEHRWSFLPEKVVYSIDFRFGEIQDELRDYYRQFFLKLKPSKKVACRIASLKLAEDIVAVQVRNTGINLDEKDVASVETIFMAMDTYPKSQRFFISAMNSDIASLFHKRYEGRCFELPQKDYTSMVDAVADMWHLGHCREMIASPCSTFSEVAWWWGGAMCPVKQLKADFNEKNVNV